MARPVDLVTFQVYVTVERKSGPHQDEDVLLDYFCGGVGRQNGAGDKTVQMSIPDGEETSVYEVRSVDDRP